MQGNELQEFAGHYLDVKSVTFSPNGQYILTGSYDQTAKLWDLQGNELQEFAGHTGFVWSVAFSPDGKHILIGSADQMAKLWRPWTYLKQRMETYSLGALKVSGFQFTKEDVLEMEKRTGKKLE